MIQASTTKAITSLHGLAAQINNLHTQSEQSYRKALDSARRAGELLSEAKAQLAHGEWLPWLKENCTFSDRTARAYMQVFRRWDKISKMAASADLTIAGALRVLMPAAEVVDAEFVEQEEDDDDPLPPSPVRHSSTSGSSSRGGRYREQPPAQSRKRSQKFQPGDIVKVNRAFNRYEKSYLGLEVKVVEVFDNFALCRTPSEYLDKVPFLFTQLQLIKSAETKDYLIEDILWIFENQLVPNQQKYLVETIIDKLPREQQIHLVKSIQDKFATVR